MSLSARSEVTTIDSHQVQLVVSETTIQQSFQVAAVTILVYHTITTLDREVKYFWGARLNTVTVVYFANRYIGTLGAIALLFWSTYGVSLALCESYGIHMTTRAHSYTVGSFSEWTFNIANWVIVISIDYILMIRVLALYSQSRRLSYVLKTMLGLEALFELILPVYLAVIEDINVAGLGPEGPTICRVEVSSPLLTPLGIVDWVIPMVYGVILMVLAIYKANEHWRMSSGFKGFDLVKILIIDQAIYFILVVACCVLNIIDLKLVITNGFVSTLLSSLGSPSILCVLGSNMFFNLKEAGERGLNQGTSYRVSSRSVSEMEFA